MPALARHGSGMRGRRFTGLIWLALLTTALAGCKLGGLSGAAAPTPSPAASASTEPPLAAAVVVVPSFPTAQLAAIYGVQEAIYITRLTDGTGTATPAIYTTSHCVPTEAQPSCLTGGKMHLGVHAGYGEFTSTGAAGGVPCVAYVFEDSAGWHSWEAVCTQKPIVPRLGQTDVVQVPPSCVDLHQGPSLSTALVGCVPAGNKVEVDGGPVYADAGAPIGQPGELWWHLKAQGWMAHQFLLNEFNLPCTEPRCALPARTCPAGYRSSATLTGVGPYTKTHLYDDFPLPPMTSEKNITGQPYVGALLCTEGTIEEVTAFIDTQFESRGFHPNKRPFCVGGSGLRAQCWIGGPNDRYEFTFSIASETGWLLAFPDPDIAGK